MTAAHEDNYFTLLCIIAWQAPALHNNPLNLSCLSTQAVKFAFMAYKTYELRTYYPRPTMLVANPSTRDVNFRLMPTKISLQARVFKLPKHTSINSLKFHFGLKSVVSYMSLLPAPFHCHTGQQH